MGAPWQPPQGPQDGIAYATTQSASTRQRVSGECGAWALTAEQPARQSASAVIRPLMARGYAVEPRGRISARPRIQGSPSKGCSVQSNMIRAGVFIGVLVLLNVLSYAFGWGRIFY